MSELGKVVSCGIDRNGSIRLVPSADVTTARIIGNGKPRNHLSARRVRRPSPRPDRDIVYALAIRLDVLVRRLAPQIRTALIEEALLRRARASVSLAEAADGPEDRLQPTMWQAGPAKVVHWEVAATSPAGSGLFEQRAFAACGRHQGIAMRDARWQHGTEESDPVTCAHCKALLQAAKS
jgi:hypothetical protein